MALNQTDILQHNNPNLAVVDSDFSKGGFRSAVATVNDLYALSGKTDEPAAAGQVKEYATIVYVTGETKYYVLTDVTNIGNAAGWSEFQTGGGAGTITGATNGLSTSGANIILGGDLLTGTTINASGNSFNLTNIGDFQVSSGLSTVFGINNDGLSFLFSGGSITYDTNQGILYGGNYHLNYTDRSLVDKEYVDILAAGLDPKSAVVVATTTNIDLTGGTFGGTIDNVVIGDGWRVLVKDQTSGATNGIYIYSASTSGFTRSTDFDGTPDGEISQGALIPVISGDSNSNTLWILVTPDPITVDVTELNFTLFSKPTVYTEGTGITINNYEISVDGASLIGNSLTWTGDTFNVDVNSGTLKIALDSKLDITTFSGYTGTTENRLTGIENDISYISGVTDTKLDIITFSGYTGTTENRLTGIENDITYLSGVTDTKLDIITFSGYTGTTQPIIDAALTGATNGLTATGRDVVLGGSLTTGTTINLTDNTFRLQSDVTSCGLAEFALNTTYADSKFGVCSIGTTGKQWGLSGNSTSISAYHCSDSSNGSSIAICNTGLTLTNKCSSALKSVSIGTCALVYGDCYHSSYTNRTLIDKEYLDIRLSGTSNVVNVTNPPIGAYYLTKRYDDIITVSGISTNEIDLYSTPVLGQRISVVDVCGNALADPITINGNGIPINDGICSTINTDYGSVTFVYNGYFWSAIAFVN